MAIKFTKGAKSTTDLIVPVAAAGGTFLYLYNKDSENVRKAAITALVVGLGIYILTTQITKRLLEASQKPDNVDVPNDTSGSGDANLNPTAWAKRLYDDIAHFNWFQSHDDKLYADMVLLSNQSLLSIYNAWNDNYAADYHNYTLVVAMKGESYNNLLNGTQDKVNTILDRYSELGVA